jgi:hypothetical protein
MSPWVNILFDIFILAALGATMRFALKLSTQFERMQADRKAFEQLISALNLASARAEAAVRTLKDAAAESGDRLQEKISAGRALSEELEIMVQAGDSLAERLGAIAEKSRKAAAPESDLERAAQDVQPQDRVSGAQPRTRAEKELLEAVKAKQQS